MRLCKKCGIFKSVDAFGKHSWCRECLRSYMKSKRSDPAYLEKERSFQVAYREQNLSEMRSKDRGRMARQQEWLNGMKSDPCVDCGRTFHPSVMDFDHVAGYKFRGIGEILGYSEEIILQEIDKCELVCANCHRVRTKSRRVNRSVNKARQRFYERIDALKVKPCLDCSECFPPESMDFDHVQEGKIATIAQMRGNSWGTVLLEIAKCELVCANCHRLRTWLRRKAAAA
jgi:hypothetical protein